MTEENKSDESYNQPTPEQYLEINKMYHSDANYSRFQNIVPNVTVRDGFTREDYEFFRTGEKVPGAKHYKDAMRSCHQSTQKLGEVHNILSMMTDFTYQGIRPIHPIPAVQKFYDSWFKKVKGVQVSERLIFTLFDMGNTPVYFTTAQLKKSTIAKFESSLAGDINYRDTDISPAKYEIPVRYTILNPASLDLVGGSFGGFTEKFYTQTIPVQLMNMVQNPEDEIEREIISSVPQTIKEAILKGKQKIVLDKNRLRMYHYKKNDWDTWAYPLVYPILDDMLMLAKTKLVDLTALDGASSRIRQFSLGNIEKGIPALPQHLQRLADIMKNNVNGGVIDLFWGPDLKITEIGTNVHEFLGSNKYQPCLNAIYRGLGVPISYDGSGSGENGAVAVKVKMIIERLAYARAILSDFWNEQFRIVQKAMGYRQAATVDYDQVIMADESVYRTFLKDLWDRGIIDSKTFRETLKLPNQVIEKRIRSEQRAADNGRIPPKASPFHNPQVKEDKEKILLQQGVGPDNTTTNKNGHPSLNKTFEPKKPNGRPKGKKDSQKRKLKVAGAHYTIWAQSAQKQISEIVTPVVLAKLERKNVRSMTDDEFDDLETLKFAILSKLNPESELSKESILTLASIKPGIAPEILSVYNSLVSSMEGLTTDSRRQLQIEAIKDVQNSDND